jgi:hypothetical protein
MKDIALIVLALLCTTLIAWLVAERRRRHQERPEPSPRRVLFPFIGRALSQPVLDATLRIARNECATLVPAYLARVPLHLPLAAAIPRQCTEAMPLLEAIEHRATAQGVPVDARIERGRNYRHALRELLSHERYDRIVVAADTAGTDGLDPEDIAWLLDRAEGEILVVRPARDTLIRVPPHPSETRAIENAARGS